jgi:hypothetical protein
MMTNLVSTDWLGDHLYTDDLVVLDASWHLPTAKRDARAEFAAHRILGARFFDIDDISDKTTTLPHMLPSADVFAEKAQALGVNRSSHVIAYDSSGLFSAARCWWMFKIFGHDKVSVLDGGLKKWLAEERTTDEGVAPMPKGGNFTWWLPWLNWRLVICRSQMPVRRRAFAAKNKNPGLASNPATFRALTTSTMPACSMQMGRSNRPKRWPRLSPVPE